MAIHCENPNTIGAETEAILNVTSTTGKALITKLSTTIENLKIHWQGTDAVANLTDLASVYTEVTDLMKNLQTIIVNVNKYEILPLQKHINLSGGSCVVGSELSPTLNDVSSFIDVPKEALESKTTPEIIIDADTFNDFPDDFSKFVEELNQAKDTLFRNWKDGANHADVTAAFARFNENVPKYLSDVTHVRDNLKTVALNKRQLM